MTTKYAEYTSDRLNDLRRTRDRASRWGQTLILVAGACGLVCLLGGIDYCLVLSPLPRGCGLGVLLAFVAAGLTRLARLLRRASTGKEVALELEQRRPELGCIISTAAEYLPGGRIANEAFEPELVAALHEQAARKLVVVETPWWRRKLVAKGYLAGCMSLLLGLAITLVPGGATAVRRVLFPWVQAAYTTIQVKPGDADVAEGADQQIEARVSGKLLRVAQLEWRPTPERPWQAAAMRRVDARRFVATLPAVRGELTYRVTAPEAQSPSFKLAPFVPPQLKHVRVRVSPPAYTKGAPREECSPNLTVLRASRLDFRFYTAGSLTDARLRFAGQGPLQLACSGPDEWTNSLVATRDAYYWLDLADQKGRHGGNDRPFKLTVLPDEKPVADIVEPGLDIRAEPTAKIPLTISASDDYGVSDLRLVFRKMSGPWHTNCVHLPHGEAKVVEATAQLDLASLDLKPYEVAAYYVEAQDNNTFDGPGIGRSPVYFCEYTTKERVLGQCHGNSTQINLLELEKQVIAATTALPEIGEESKYHDLAGSQRQTRSYARVFSDGFLLAIAPKQARAEFDLALLAMDQASTNLDRQSRSAALTSEESALRHLYETCRLLPELEAGMCRGQGNCIKIVLDALEKLKEQQKKQRRESLPEMLQQARRLVQLQQHLNELYARRQGQTNSNAPGPAASPVGEKQARKQAQSLGASQLAEGRTGEQDNLSSNGKDGDRELTPSEPANFALGKEQRQLANAAAELAHRLELLSGKDPRVSFRYSGMVRQTSDLWGKASEAVANADAFGPGRYGALGISLLGKVVTALEVIDGEASPPGDLAAEEYPKQFEAQINDYLKRLSYAE